MQCLLTIFDCVTSDSRVCWNVSPASVLARGVGIGACLQEMRPTRTERQVKVDPTSILCKKERKETTVWIMCSRERLLCFHMARLCQDDPFALSIPSVESGGGRVSCTLARLLCYIPCYEDSMLSTLYCTTLFNSPTRRFSLRLPRFFSKRISSSRPVCQLLGRHDSPQKWDTHFEPKSQKE